MKSYAVAVLELALGDARRLRATEVRFMSGMYPSLMVDGILRYVEGADLKSETIQSIHHECLTLAGHAEMESRATATYAFASPRFGRCTCRYERRGNIATLTVVPDGGDTEVIDAVRPVKPPQLQAEAHPEESGPASEGGH